MKQFTKSLLIGSILIASTFAKAQNADESKYWSRLDLKFDKGIQEITSKFNGYQGSTILFNEEKVKIKVFKTVACAAGMQCPQVMAEPLVIRLDVVKVVKSQCYDSYYAKTPDDVKSSEYEQIIINRFANERCHSLLKIRDGYVHYKISGISKLTGLQSAGHAYATMINVVKVENVSIIDPVLPEE